MKKRWIWALISVVVVGAVALSGCAARQWSLVEGGSLSNIQVEVASQQQGIWVNGEGEAIAIPDIVMIRLGIESRADAVDEAQTQAQQAMDAVMNALKTNGVAESDIQTDYFSVRQVTRWDDRLEEEEITGYRVTNMVTAKVRDVDAAGAVIDAVVSAGGDLIRIDDINFTVDDMSAYYETARAEAIADAEAKAEQLARLAGVELGDPVYITESIYTPYIYRDYAMEAAGALAPVETSISPGELEITANVQMVYDIVE